MKTEWRRGLVVASLAAISTTGCYRYVPAQMEATPPGTDVRVLVTRAGAREMEEAGALDPSDEPRVSGTVVGTEGDDLLVRIPIAQRQDGFIVSRIEQAVRLPMGEVVSFQRREVNALSTGLLLTGGAAALAGLVAIIANPLGGDASDPEPPPDEFFMFELLSIPFGR